jgi:hypothetical protein
MLIADQGGGSNSGMYINRSDDNCPTPSCEAHRGSKAIAPPSLTAGASKVAKDLATAVNDASHGNLTLKDGQVLATDFAGCSAGAPTGAVFGSYFPVGGTFGGAVIGCLIGVGVANYADGTGVDMFQSTHRYRGRH